MAQFVAYLLARMEVKWEGFNEAMKSLGYHLQWRERALDAVSADVAWRMTFQAQELVARCAAPHLLVNLHTGPPRESFAFIERHSLVLIAFLLRKRIDDEDYMKPQSDDVRLMKRVLATPYYRLRDRHLETIPGAVQSKVLLRRVLRYINRHGTGTIVAD